MRRQPLAGIVECQPYQVNLSDPASVGADAFVRPAGKARVRLLDNKSDDSNETEMDVLGREALISV